MASRPSNSFSFSHLRRCGTTCLLYWSEKHILPYVVVVVVVVVAH